MSDCPSHHPASMLFPMMTQAELRELADDIKANGLLESIELYEGTVLDGRNRLAACQLAQIEPHFKNLNGSHFSPVLYVLSKNLHRRQLTPSQRAAIAVESIPMLQEEARKRQETGKKIDLKTNWSEGKPLKGSARELAAQALQVGEGTLQRAMEVKKADPVLFEQIKRGTTTANAARQKLNGHIKHTFGTRTDKHGIYETNTQGKNRLAEGQFKRMKTILTTVEGACAGLPKLDYGMIRAVVSDADEILPWIDIATKSAKALRDFVGIVKGNRA